MSAENATDAWVCNDEGIGRRLLQEVGRGWHISRNDGRCGMRLTYIGGGFRRVAEDDYNGQR